VLIFIFISPNNQKLYFFFFWLMVFLSLQINYNIFLILFCNSWLDIFHNFSTPYLLCLRKHHLFYWPIRRRAFVVKKTISCNCLPESLLMSLLRSIFLTLMVSKRHKRKKIWKIIFFRHWETEFFKICYSKPRVSITNINYFL
jgi:hypothetical protein